MNQSNRTLTYVAIAVVAVAVAYFSRPARVGVTPDLSAEALLLFPQFTDPTRAASLEIKRYDEDKIFRLSGTAIADVDEDAMHFDKLQVVEKNRVWTIPSHDDYPADAKSQIVDVASLLSDLRVTSIEPEANATQRERFGVLEPTVSNFKKHGPAGIGMRVTVRDAAKKELADLIVGKEVPGKPDQRYVALPGQKRVATIKIAVDKLSTKFGDWIETDLLTLGSVWDVSKLALHDYSFDLDRGPQERARMTFDRPADKNEWRIVDLEQFDEQQSEYVSAMPGEDEELDSQKIDDMRSALNELKIVNVERKPAKFRDSLGATGQINLSQETARSLQDKGFYLIQTGSDDDPAIALVSSDGELTVTMKDGVEYVLRFGAVADFDKGEPAGSTSGAGEAEADESEDEGDKSSIDLHRYLFVVAQFDEDAVEKPEFEKLPDAAKDEAEKDEAASDDKADNGDAAAPSDEANKADDDSTPPDDAEVDDAEVDDARVDDAKVDETPGDEESDTAKPDGAKPDAPAAESPTDAGDGDPQAAASLSPLRFVASQNDQAEAGESADAQADDAKDDEPNEVEPKADNAKAEDATSDEAKPDEAQPDDATIDTPKPTDDAKPDDAASVDPDAPSATDDPTLPDAATETPEDAAKRLDAERTRIEAENSRKQEEYDEKVAAAKKKVKELNERFADWYYVIPEDVYKKIHLSRADVIKKKAIPAAETSPDSATPSDFPNLPPTLGNE